MDGWEISSIGRILLLSFSRSGCSLFVDDSMLDGWMDGWDERKLFLYFRIFVAYQKGGDTLGRNKMLPEMEN